MFSSLPSRLAATLSRAGSPATRGAYLGGGLIAAALAISSCSTSNVLSLRPDVDVGTRTAGVPDGSGLRDAVADDPYAAGQSASAEPADANPGEAQPADMGEQGGIGQSDEPQPDDLSQTLIAPVDAQPVDAQPAYAESVQAGPVDAGPVEAEPVEAQPGRLPPVEPDQVGRLPVETGEQAAPVQASLAGGGLPPVEPDQVGRLPVETEEQAEPILAAYPRVDNPISPPRMSLPADEVACRQELKRLGVVFKELPPINDGGSCSIAHPILVSGLPGGVAMKPAATLNCQMAATFALWTRKELSPAARLRYFSSVKAIHQASSYSCRRINGTHTMSEHSKGNALDVSRIELSSGRDIDVRKPGLFAFRTRGFLNNVRTDGCDYFTTVLGPGYNRDHRDHFHFDIKPRRNGRHACH